MPVRMDAEWTQMQIVGSLLNFLGNLVGSYLLARPWPWIRLDVQHDRQFFFAIGSDVRSSPVTYSAVIRLHNAGRVRFTVKEAGWVAGDGERLAAHLPPDLTLEPGGPEFEAFTGARELLAFTSEHRGLSWAYVQLAGKDKPHRRRIDNDWRELLRERGA